MIAHISIGVRDVERSKRFYDAVLEPRKVSPYHWLLFSNRCRRHEHCDSSVNTDSDGVPGTIDANFRNCIVHAVIERYWTQLG